MRKLALAALCAAGVMGLACQAAAATVEIDRTIDLGSVVPAGTGLSLFSGGLDVTVQQGDTLVLRVDFLSGQSLTANGLTRAQAGAFFTQAPGVFGVSGLVDLSFFTSGGTVTLPTAGLTGTTSNVGLIGQLLGSDLAGAPTTFTGFSFALPVTIQGATSLHFTEESFGFEAGSFSSPDLGAAKTPEPETWALMLAGFGIAGAALRRRRAVA